jgi:hypothetical protein
LGNEFAQKSKPLSVKLPIQERGAGDIAARTVEAGNETQLNRVITDAKDDRNCRGRSFGRDRSRRAAGCRNHRHLASDQISGKFRQSIVFTLCKAGVDREIAALDKAHFAQPFPPCRIGQRAVAGAEIPDHRHPRLLRPRRERQRRRASERDYEFSSCNRDSHWTPLRQVSTLGSGTIPCFGSCMNPLIQPP